MNAVVLCAGLGTRLRPVTERWPKPAVPFLGVPLFRLTLGTLRAGGVRRVGINTFHLPGVMEAVAEAECAALGLELTVSREVGVIQGTGGGLRAFRALLGEGDAVVFNGDILFPVDIAAVVGAHRASGAAATMVLAPMPAGARYNTVEVDGGGVVRRIAGVPLPSGPAGDVTGWHFTGVHVVSHRVLDFVPAGPSDVVREVYPAMAGAGLTVRGDTVTARDTRWSDLGAVGPYLDTQRAVLEAPEALGPLGTASPFAGLAVSGEGLVHPTARVGPVRSAGRWLAAAGATVGAGSRLEWTVVGRHAAVGADCQLTGVAVLDGAEVAAGTTLEDVVVAPGGVVVPR